MESTLANPSKEKLLIMCLDPICLPIWELSYKFVYFKTVEVPQPVPIKEKTTTAVTKKEVKPPAEGTSSSLFND